MTYAGPVPELDSTLDGYAISKDYVRLDEDVIADIAIFPENGTRKYMSKRPDARPIANIVGLA